MKIYRGSLSDNFFSSDFASIKNITGINNDSFMGTYQILNIPNSGSLNQQNQRIRIEGTKTTQKNMCLFLIPVISLPTPEHYGVQSFKIKSVTDGITQNPKQLGMWNIPSSVTDFHIELENNISTLYTTVMVGEAIDLYISEDNTQFFRFSELTSLSLYLTGNANQVNTINLKTTYSSSNLLYSIVHSLPNNYKIVCTKRPESRTTSLSYSGYIISSVERESGIFSSNNGIIYYTYGAAAQFTGTLNPFLIGSSVNPIWILTMGNNAMVNSPPSEDVELFVSGEKTSSGLARVNKIETNVICEQLLRNNPYYVTKDGAINNIDNNLFQSLRNAFDYRTTVTNAQWYEANIGAQKFTKIPCSGNILPLMIKQ